MAGIIGLDIKKSDKIFILVNLVGSGRNFSLGDFAKNAFVHKIYYTINRADVI